MQQPWAVDRLLSICGLMSDVVTNIWLMKSEPKVFTFDDLMVMPGRRVGWDGVRNYLARNYMRDHMRIGDLVLFYHSNAKPSHIAGLAEVASESYPDISALNPDSRFFDPKASVDRPRWYQVDVRALRPLQRVLTITELRKEPRLSKMALVQPGQRVSIQPVTEAEFEVILELEISEPAG